MGERIGGNVVAGDDELEGVGCFELILEMAERGAEPEAKVRNDVRFRWSKVSLRGQDRTGAQGRIVP